MMVMMVVVMAPDWLPALALLETLEILLQCGKSALCARNIAGLQGFAQRRDIRANRVGGAIPLLPALGLPSLPQLLQGGEGGLRAGQIPGLQRAGEILKVLLALLVRALHIGLVRIGIGTHTRNRHDLRLLPIVGGHKKPYQELLGCDAEKLERL